MKNITSNVLFISLNDLLPISFKEQFKECGYSIIEINSLISFHTSFQEEAEKSNIKCIILSVSFHPIKTVDQLVAIRNVFNSKIPIIGLFSQSDFGDYEKISRLPVDDILFYPCEINVLVARIQFRINQIQKIIDYYNLKIDRYQKGLKLLANHEFNTPMTAIIGFSELVKLSINDISKSELINYINYIHNSANRLLELMRRVRIWQDLERRVFLSPHYSVGIDHNYISELMKKIAVKYKREADVFLEYDEFKVSTDELAVQLIVSELIENAFKFSKPETMIWVSLIHNEISIKSTTIYTFDKQRDYDFYQHDRERQEQQGLGLGISIVQLCCNAINAKLRLSKEDNLLKVKIQFYD